MERLGRTYARALAAQALDLNPNTDIYFAGELHEPLTHLRVIAYFEAVRDPLVLAESPFRQSIDRLRSVHGDFEVEEQLELQGAEVLATLNDFDASVRRRVVEAVQATSGETVTARRRRVANQLLQAGGEVATHVRTMSQVAYGSAQWEITQNDPDVWGYVYITMADERVRENHAAMHGVVRDKEDPIWHIWWPPNGWNCRCKIIAVPDEVPETDLRRTGGAQPDEGWAFNSGMVLFS